MSKSNDFFKKAHQFTDKVLDGAEKGVGKAKEVFDEMTEPVKLEWKIAEAGNALDALLLEYGKVKYYDSENEDKIAFIAGAIEDKEAERKKLMNQLDAIKEKAKADKEKVFCTKCGTKCDSKENYCSKCGNGLKK